MPLSPGDRLGNFEILSLLGSGGMGNVYKARDLELRREVAIKVLRTGLLSEGERLRRFEQEARTASALNHPNIVTIYEVGQHQGMRYIVMELVDGSTLRELLSSGRLLPRKLLDVARQTAEGLAKAHTAGIVHRDLKPENIMLTRDGWVKILDFGIAKLRPASSADSEATTRDDVTQEGVIMGTVAYMSPEQAKGLSVDYRTDQFSLGVILYELLAGRRPFRGESAAETRRAILEDEPESVTTINTAIPPQLARIVERCLAKDPQDRYDSTRDLARDILAVESTSAPLPNAVSRARRRAVILSAAAVLAVLAAGWLLLRTRGTLGLSSHDTSALGIESLAVLPLANLSGDPEQEYFVEGLTEALITELSRIRALRVVSRTSVMRYKNARAPLPEIARELDVDAVVEGSVLQAGNRVRVTAQLIHAATDRHLWAENYDRDRDDVLALLSEVAREIAREVRVALTPAEKSRLAAARSVDPEAYEAYLRGRYHFNRTSAEELDKAVGYFERAIAIEPSYAAAYSGLADSYNRLGMTFVGRPPGELRPRAIAAASEALRIDEGLAEAHVSLGWAKFFDWDWHGAEASFRRAIELDPKYAEAHQLYSLYLVAMGRFDEAVAEGRKAVELDPLSINSRARLGQVLAYSRRYDEGIRELEDVVDLDPNFVFALFHLGDAYSQVSRFDEAVSVLEKATALSKRNPAVLGYLGCAYARGGRSRDGRDILEEMTRVSETRYVSPFTIAWLHACLSDRESAFEWLEKAFAERSYLMVYLAVYAPSDESIRAEPRFEDLLRRMRFPSTR